VAVSFTGGGKRSIPIIRMYIIFHPANALNCFML
jgi:hypothetical protein